MFTKAMSNDEFKMSYNKHLNKSRNQSIHTTDRKRKCFFVTRRKSLLPIHPYLFLNKKKENSLTGSCSNY